MMKRPAMCPVRGPVIWAIGWFLLAHLSIVGFLEWKCPDFYDPKYGIRLMQLRARLGHARGAKVFIVLGSSRAEQGFRPSRLPVSLDWPEPVVFNLARGGSSPVLNLLTLRRLLADGICPDWMLLEIFPPSLVEERSGVTIVKPTLRDFPLLRRYRVSGKTYAYFVRDRGLLWSKYRSSILTRFAPGWLTPPAYRPERYWDARGGEWLAIGEAVTLPESRALTADARRRYFRKLQDFRISPRADQALRELLATCRERAIGVALFLMPEASEFRAWYPAPALERLSSYLEGLQHQYGITLIDARHWIADNEFCDGHHLLANGAASFTTRFGTEVLSRLVHPAAE